MALGSDDAHMAADPHIGTRIRKRRQVLRMTQDGLAAELGVSKSTVANWERGKHFPLRYLGAIEDVLGVSLDGGTAPETEPETEWERWERSVLTNPHLPRDVAEAMVRDARDARDAYQAESSAGRPGGSSSGPSRPSAAAAG